MQKIKALAILNAISFLIHVTLSYMTQFRVVNKKDVSEVSDQYFSLFTPAPFTFAIWGIIYTFLGIFCLYHIVMAYKHDKVNPANTDIVTIGGWFIITNLASAAWLIAWTNDRILVSVVLIFIQLLSLIIIHQRINIHSRLRSSGSKVCTELPLSTWLGWISIAAIANTAVYLVATGWDGMGLPNIEWTMIMIGVAILLGVIIIFTRKNIAFGAVIMWGLYGILSKLETLDDSYTNIINMAWGGIALLGLCCLIQLVKSFSYRKRSLAFPEAARPIK